MEIKFIADNNVGKLARWLRLIGYDTLLFKQKDDGQMIKIALSENRVILTKDTQFMKRRLVTNGKLKTIHIKQDDPKLQVQEVVKTLNLNYHFKPFSLCLECNRALIARDKEEVKNLVPAQVIETQTQYTQCPACHRIYWPGTHWQAMVKKLQDLQGGGGGNHAST
ncbi:MAG: Mut7-C RNAse domain-containing protein [Dehalococcoidia bacterium]|nr:Mut7-C RNAse domain-containing protein [Dehalococcoidia bacterium]